MKPSAEESKNGSAELNKLINKCSALLAALFLLFALLASSLVGGEALEAISGLTSADPLGFINVVQNTREADTQPTPSITVQIAEMENGVAPEVAARLLSITAEVLNKGIDLSGEGPKILIYHTHDTEAYTQTPDYEYVPSGDWRTEDQTKSVVAVGEELARILNDEYGIVTLHDTTPHEPPLITTAYTRSLTTMQKYKQQYPSLEMFIDLHRDGVGSEGYENDYVQIEGKQVAKMMFVVGTGKNAAGTPEDPKPDFEANYALAAALTERLRGVNNGLMRKIRVKVGKYNQFVSNKCVLVEVGHNANTLEQALAAMPYLAAAIAETAGIRPAGRPIDFTP